MRFAQGEVQFSVITVVRARATAQAVMRMAEATAAVSELRACSSITAHVLGAGIAGRYTQAMQIAGRLRTAPDDAPRTCILDSGVHRTNPLLEHSLPEARCYTINEAWTPFDWGGHGTKVAGIALFGDLERHIGGRGPIQLSTALESVTVLRPPHALRPTVFGSDDIAQAISTVEINNEGARRVYCLASAAYGDREDGSPASLSAAIDQLAWGKDGEPRLFCIAAGNVLDDPLQVAGYIARNDACGVTTPGQAYNALTVGGCTHNDEHPDDGALLAPRGDLCPTSRTSRSWSVKTVTKPDVVMEGGNHGVDEQTGHSEPLSELKVLTTNNHGRSPLSVLGDTSAATACVAGMATRITAAYPDLWPETVRGLIVHSADWTPAMLRRMEEVPRGQRADALMTRYGWGMPDERLALESASNNLTLIVQDELQPFRRDGQRVRMNAMKYYKLPWPREALLAIAAQTVQLRVTLSYFIEPDPSRASIKDWAQYASHRFDFDVKSPDDDDDEAVQRHNRAARPAGDFHLPPRRDRGWTIGFQRRRWGSLHKDVWTGRADDLAQKDGVSVMPRGGWWMNAGAYAEVAARYALIVSIGTPEVASDIYLEVRNAIAARMPVATPVRRAPPRPPER